MAELILRFNGGTAWMSLDWIGRQLIGTAALELITAQRTLALALPGTAEQRAARHAVDRLQGFLADAAQGALPAYFADAAPLRIPSLLGQVCRICGCSEHDACVQAELGHLVCSWAKPDLCTACAATEAQ